MSAETTIELAVETRLSAHCGRETLLVRCDAQRRQWGSVAIDENDSGTVVSVCGDVEILTGLCRGLSRAAVKDANEQRLTNFAQEPEGSATLIEGVDRYELKLVVQGERKRSLSFSIADGKLLCKAIRGTFSLWD